MDSSQCGRIPLGFEESYATRETWKEPSLWMHRCSNKVTQAHSLGTPRDSSVKDLL